MSRVYFAQTIVGVLSGGQVPNGVGENVLVIAQQSVLIHDGNGGAVALALKSDVQGVKDAIAKLLIIPERT